MSVSPQATSRPRRRRLAALWVLLGAVALWFWIGHAGRVRLNPAQESPPAGDPRLADLRGSPLDLRTLRGKVVVLNLWAGWCGPCRAEIPRLNRLQTDLGPAGLVVVGVNVEDLSPDELESLVERLGITFSVVRPDRPLSGPLRPAGSLPQTWFIDRAGRVRATRVGLVAERALRRACTTLLEEDSG